MTNIEQTVQPLVTSQVAREIKIETSNIYSVNKVLLQQILETVGQITSKTLHKNPQQIKKLEPLVLELYRQLTRFLFNLEAEENRRTGQISISPDVCLLVTKTWNHIWGNSGRKEIIVLNKGYISKMNTTPENVPDETLLQAKVVRAQLLIKTNTRNIVREIWQTHMIDLEIRTMQIGEFELMIQLDLEDHLTGKSLATIGHFRPTGDVLTKLQQRIDTDIETLYRIIQEHPGINQTVFMTSEGEWIANQLQYLP